MSAMNSSIEAKPKEIRPKSDKRAPAAGDSAVEVLLRIEVALQRLGEMVALTGRDQGAQIAALRNLGCDWPRIGQLVGLKANTARMRFTRDQTEKEEVQDA